MDPAMKNRKSPVLPIVADNGAGSTAKRTAAFGARSSRGRGRGTAAETMPGFIAKKFVALMLIACCGLGGAAFLRRRSAVMPGRAAVVAEDRPDFYQQKAQDKKYAPDDETEAARQLVDMKKEGGRRPLDAFPTLSRQLQTTEIVALYFAASWCPMSTPVTNQLDELFRDELDDSSFAILYVSSDKDAASFESYPKPGWHTVPFESADDDERAGLKRHFRTCAKREMERLGVGRRDGEIPRLIVLDGGRQRVLTGNGVRDVRERGAAALDHWRRLAAQPSTRHGETAIAVSR